MIALLLAALALADEGAICTGSLAAPPEALSVAWVSPLRERVGASGWIDVVETASLRAWIRKEPSPTVGRTLQRLGMRATAKDPRRRWKVTIFEIEGAGLCRPVEEAEPGELIDGLPACARPRVGAHTTGCGRLVDRGDGSASLPVYRIQWRDLAAKGFCVLPAERFVGEGGR